jgi:PIN domain nuclease of toxin-antitoxin system
MIARSGVLLDTCAVIWLAEGERLASPALDAIIEAGLSNRIFVSPISAWEVGMLARPRQGREPALAFEPDPQTWFARVMAGPGVAAAALTPQIGIDASFLPGEPHADPADRLMIATARRLGVPLVTRDRKIIAYSELGFVQALVC